jgi:CDP-2,3-bis-(O-geranylgeranyl)-sn-glycerol synthase
VDPWLLGLRLLLLLTAANTAPILCKRVLGARWSAPIDFGRRFVDGRPWLGPSKTWRGLLSAVLAAGVLAPVLGFPPAAGAAAGLLAMAGDALSSFLKRRLGIPSSGQAFAIDQLPESLLPLLVLQAPLGLPWGVVAGVTLAFVLLETPMAWLAHRIGLRDEPY